MAIFFLMLLILCATEPTMIPIIIILFICLIIYAVQTGNKEDEIRKSNAKKIMGGGIDNFSPTRIIDSIWINAAIYIDETHKKLLLVENMKKDTFLGNPIRFDELVECSILEDGATVQSGGIGRAVVGGVMAGGVGAIVGAATRGSKPITRELSVRIITSNTRKPLYVIPLITSETNRESSDYKRNSEFAQKIYATIVSIIHSNQA